MRWCLITHPDIDGTPVVIAEDSLGHYEARGWTRVSGWTADPHLPIEQFPPREDSKPAPEPASAKSAKTSKEGS